MIGAAYAAGMSGKAIRRHVIELAHNRAEVFRRLIAARARARSPSVQRRLRQRRPWSIAEKFCRQFLPDNVPDDFAELEDSADAWSPPISTRGSEVVFSTGPLRPALAASIAICRP